MAGANRGAIPHPVDVTVVSLQARPATTGFGIWAPLAPERQR